MPLHVPALTYFLAVYESGSINAAARRMFIASSAVSRQIAGLERDVGAPLFERHPSGVVATDVGHRLAAYARRAVQEADDVLADLRDQQVRDTVIDLAAPNGIGHDVLPRIAADFQRANPAVRFVLSITEPREATRLVKEGHVDIAVTFSLTLEAGIHLVLAQPAPLHAIVRAGHPLSTRSKVGLPDVLRYPVVLNAPNTTNRELVDLVTAAHGKPLKPAFVCTNPDAIIRFIQESNAVGFTSGITVARDVARGDIVAMDLREREFAQRSLHVETKAGRTLPMAVAAFADFVAAELQEAQV